MVLELINKTKANIEDLNKGLKLIGQNAINDEVKRLLAEPDIQIVSWSQKSSEYNDEGMYPGVFGPIFNRDTEERYSDALYGYSRTAVDPRGNILREILNALGDEVLSEIFDDEAIVDATWADGVVDYEVECVGW